MKHFLGLMITVLIGAQWAQAHKQIVVDLSKQEAYAYEDGRLQFSGWISTGKPGHRTPTGHFRVLEKDIDHVSSKYPAPHGGAEMHYMLRVTGYGVAMHLGYVPNYPASHGCIRMENGFAQKMYRWADVGTPILIKGYPPRHVDRPISRNAARFASSSRATPGSYEGNDPLKFLSSVPGKRASVEKKISRNTKRKRRKKHNGHKKMTEMAQKPMTPLEMLRGNV
ncbi:L,D-transpeptidase family protein [Nitratifractor sp.]|uniref:L,D-transpeptidase family protein n=1 Tax=Nitratifractor sp. TaxID=2268144 RepID=UPI0025EED5AC|nr:L,D-transpeptidase family protein [Nitratifractor sp.]